MALLPAAVSGTFATLSALLRITRRLAREERLSSEELALRRHTRLKQLLARAAQSTYYNSAFRDAGIADFDRFEPGDLRRLPFLDRRVIAQHGLDAFLTVPRTGLIDVMTSGSTGTPGHFLRSRLEEAEYSARWWRVYSSYGCRPGDAQVNIAIPDKPDRAGAITYLRKLGLLPQVVKLASDDPPEELLTRIRKLSPPILTGYAGAIEALAEHTVNTSTRIHPPRAVFCTAMEVTDRCLELAEQAFRAPAVDVYVTNEFGVIAWSCPERRNLLHVNDDCFVVEVVDEQGAPVADGNLGELVVTSLGLTSMPLIRYRMGDMAARLPEGCQCGRGLGLLTRVHGRTAHVIRRPSGALITTPLITSLFGRAMAHSWVRRYQVREEPGRQLRFLLATRRAPSTTEGDTLSQIVHASVGHDFNVTIEIVDQIPASPNGKLQFLVPLASNYALDLPD